MKKMIYILFCLVISYTFIACSDNEEDEEESRYDYYKDEAGIHSQLEGVWAQVNIVDSTIFVFENRTMKKFVYQRGKDQIIEMTDFGNYSARKVIYKKKEESEPAEFTYIKLYFYYTDYDTKNSIIYSIKNNILDFYLPDDKYYSLKREK